MTKSTKDRFLLFIRLRLHTFFPHPTSPPQSQRFDSMRGIWPLRIFREEVDAAIDPNGSVESVLPALVAWGRDEPQLVRDLAIQSDYGTGHQGYEVANVCCLLLQVLDQIDSDGSLLLSVVTNPRVYWQVRQDSVRAISKRDEPRLFDALLDHLIDDSVPMDNRDTAVVRCAIIEELSKRGFQKLLPVIRQWMDERIWEKQDWLSRRALLDARRRLGDVLALRELIEGGEYWSFPFSDSFDDLVLSLGGVEGALAFLQPSLPPGSLTERLVWFIGKESGAVRRWALDWLIDSNTVGERLHGERIKLAEPDIVIRTLIKCLGDDSWTVACGAYIQITDLAQPPVERLFEVVTDPTAPRTQRLWASYTLLDLGHCVDGLVEQIPDYRVELPDRISPALREAVLRRWDGVLESDLDVRWLIERLQLAPFSASDARILLNRLLESLRDQGLLSEDLPPYLAIEKEWYDSIRLAVAGKLLRASTFGPLIAFVRGNATGKFVDAVRRACESAGWELLDDTTLQTRFGGLINRDGLNFPEVTAEELLFGHCHW